MFTLNNMKNYHFDEIVQNRRFNQFKVDLILNERQVNLRSQFVTTGLGNGVLFDSVV